MIAAAFTRVPVMVSSLGSSVPFKNRQAGIDCRLVKKFYFILLQKRE
jgi:hypothetical protein